MKSKSLANTTSPAMLPPGLCPIEDAAAILMISFWEKQKEQQEDPQWRDKIKGDAMSLLWKCEFKKKSIPTDLMILIGCLFGDRHSWTFAKYDAVSHLAYKWAPIKRGTSPPRGAISALSKILKKHGGVLKAKRPLDDSKGNIERDYRATIYGWFDDELFLYLWAEKHERLKAFKEDPASVEKINIARSALSHSR